MIRALSGYGSIFRTSRNQKKGAHEKRMESYQALGLRQRQCWVRRITAE
ncbi:hypothetical protein NB636_09640 [Oxalobacter aliiformigenes]|nr:hypothetical protein [Oxalobacter aliiformigenes]MCZ4064822.1 hypothetical protein [Oxalobacter aliiformigenes]WAV98936.1 hypothetical protein NB636_09640 [Oxalobacter aliiformigenes]